MDSDHIEFMIDRATEKLEDRILDMQATINGKQVTIDALVAALDRYATFHRLHFGVGVYGQDYDEALNQADAALALARGGK